MRRTGMGGSDTAAIFGLDKFKRPWDLYVDKVEGWVKEATPDMKRGRFLEQGLSEWYGDTYGVEVINPNKTFRHATRPLILATPDRLLNLPSGEVELLSIKSPRGGDEWGEDETEVYPLRANVQVQQEHAVLRSHGYVITRAWVAALVWGELRRYPVRLDDDMQQRLMRCAEVWWGKHVATKTPPPLDGGDGAKRWLQARYPTAEGKEKAEATLQQEALALALKDAEATRDAAEEAYDTAKARVIESMGPGYGLTGSFGSITNFNNKYGTRTFRPRWKT